jgi:uncharacterized protein YxeA
MKKIIILIIILLFIFSAGIVKAKTLDDFGEFGILKAWYDKVTLFLNNIFSKAKQEVESRMRQSLEQTLENIKNKILEAIF